MGRGPGGGLGGEPQEDPAALARRGAYACRSASGSGSARRLDRAGRAAAGRAAQPRLGADFQFDTTATARTLKLLHVVDEHTREALAIRVARSIDADHAVRVLDQIVRERGTAPELVRMDNGPEMTANALRDWCRLGGAGRSFIEPGSPWQNPFVESFGSRVRDELLSVEAFNSVLEAQTVINDWRTIYNHKRPHSSLGWRAPAAYAASLNRQSEEQTPRLS